jgi:hypothetical protein
MSQVAMKNGATPMMTGPEPKYEREPVLTEEELERQAIANQALTIAHSAAFDDFEYETLKYMAQQDPIWKPVLAEADATRKTDQPN